MEGSITGGTSIWMLYLIESNIKIADLGVPPFMETFIY